MGPAFTHIAKGVEKVKISKLFPTTKSVVDRSRGEGDALLLSRSRAAGPGRGVACAPSPSLLAQLPVVTLKA